MSDFELLPETESGRPAAKRSRLVDRIAAGRPDDFQTPPLALQPLLPYLKRRARVIWEPAAGKHRLACALLDNGFGVYTTDILDGPEFDFLTYVPTWRCDAIVTNPPYSLKDEFLARCYALALPFALLMPLTALEGQRRQALYRQHGLELLLMDKRINFETPSGKQGGSWFASAWYTWGLGIGRDLTFTQLKDTQ